MAEKPNYWNPQSLSDFMEGIQHKAYETSMHRTLARVGVKPHESDDMVQEAYMLAARHFDKYTPGTNFKAWLLRVTRNRGINFVRKERRASFIHIDEENDEGNPFSDILASDESADTYVSDSYSAAMRDALEALPPEYRSVLLLVDVDEFTYKEAAARLECPVGTVMSRLHRAREQVAQYLAHEFLRENTFFTPELAMQEFVRQYSVRGKKIRRVTGVFDATHGLEQIVEGTAN